MKMENITLQNQEVTNLIKFKAHSLVSTMLPVTLNQVMIAKSILLAKSYTLLLQKDVDLDQLVNINPQQEEMRRIARQHLDQHLPKILSLLTDITGFYSSFCSYYEDIDYYITKLNNNDEDEQSGLLADLEAMLNDIISVIKEKKENTKALAEILITDNEESALLNKKFNQTKVIIEQCYTGDKIEIRALETLIQKLLKNIEQCNNQIASGALDSAKNILKISTTLIAKYIQEKKPETKPETKPKTKTETDTSKNPLSEATPIVANNLQLFNGNKTIETLAGMKLQQSIALYRETIQKLQKYNNEATIVAVLIQQWDTFFNSMIMIAESIEYLAKAWQELEQNFTTFKDKFLANENIDASIIEYMKQQWSLTYSDLLQLNSKATNFQRLAYLDVVKDSDKDKVISSYAFRTLLNVPNLKSPQLNQRIIIENSKE